VEDLTAMEMNSDAPRLAADRMLARLARWLRLCGVDITFDKRVGGAEMLHAARHDRRFVLTRDKRLRTAPDALYLTSEQVREQLREVLNRFGINPQRSAFTRCTRCNSLLREVSRLRSASRDAPIAVESFGGPRTARESKPSCPTSSVDG
jgi:uncharacterized protein